MKTLLTLSSIALIVSSSLAMAGNGNGQGKGNFTSLDANNDGVITIQEAKGRSAKNFTSLDSNGDGQLTVAEFNTLKGKQGNKQNKLNNKGKQGQKGNNQQFAQSANRFAEMDANNDGSVSEEEFNQAATQRQVERVKQIASRPTFAQLDSDGDGNLSKDERKAMSANNGKQGNKDNKSKGNGYYQANKTGKADSNGDGVISQQEFTAMQEKQSIKRAERMANRPTFTDLDSDGNGTISAAEHKAFSQKRASQKQALKQQS